MRRIRLVKVSTPESVARTYDSAGNRVDEDFRCTECGMGVAREYACCPYCKCELDWGKIISPSDYAFRNLVDYFRNYV